MQANGYNTAYPALEAPRIWSPVYWYFPPNRFAAMHDTMPEPFIRRGLSEDVDPLVAMWRRSVEATHNFLTAADITMLEPEVRAGLERLEVWVADAGKVTAGFMAMHGNMIEALFIDPACMGMKLGTRFIEHARKLRGDDTELRVDVNEGNPAAVGFYRAKGFQQIGRSETDGAGRPWPLLHLRLHPGHPSHNPR